MTTRRPWLLSFLPVALLVASCFDAPIREALALDCFANGAVRLTATVELSGTVGENNSAVKRRLAEAEDSLLAGRDPWAARFAALEPDAEHFSWERRLGELRQVRRAAWAVKPEALERFFAATDVALSYRVDGARGLAELSIQPGPSSRGGRREQRRVQAALRSFGEAIATYQGATAALYAYVEDHPDRTEACLGNLYADLLSETEKAALPTPSVEEKALLDRLGETVLALWQVLEVEAGEEMSLDEASRLVLDPFPAKLTVTPPAAASDVEGFRVLKDGSLEVPEVSLWPAFERLAGRWVSPEPALLLLPVARGSAGQPLALASILGQARRFPSPTELPAATDWREALVAELAPAPRYHAIWPIDPEAEPEFGWRE